MNLSEEINQRLLDLDISHNHKLLVAVSGGPDSMCLLHVLMHLQFDVSVAHVNYGLRGKSSDADSRLVEEWCSVNCIPFYIYRVSDAEREMAGNFQENARQIRYSWFDELCATHAFDFVLTAHHANDQAETILHHFIRGSGFSGLKGISPRNDSIIRPLLEIEKQELVRYCLQYAIPYRTDASNDSIAYTRNAIRKLIVPQLEQLNTKAVQHINFAHRNATFYDHLFEQSFKSFFQKHVTVNPFGFTITFSPDSVTYQFLEFYLFELLSPYEFTFHQCTEMAQKYPFVKGHTFISRNQSTFITTDIYLLHIHFNLGSEDSFYFSKTDLRFEARCRWYSIHSALVPVPNFSNNIDNAALYINADKLNELDILPWIPGDRFIPLGMKHSKKISDYLIDNKVSKHLRPYCKKLVNENKDIIALLPLCVDDRYKVTASTTLCLRLSVEFYDRSYNT